MLGRETQQVGLLVKQLKGSILELQTEEKSIQRQSADIRKAFDEVLEGHQALERHVRKLELRLNGEWRPAKQRRASYLSRLKTQTEQQNLTLRFLMDIVQHQQQQMAEQRQQLSQLQEQIPNHLATRLR
ncbi:angiopoietin-like protein 8 isoform X2 [Ambystoma mexicanum]|uniref:angiopoietin-like protein 8 isoform X2 n=1 Tax=Ambystoma mexicanum TaxID=8296 RepID=UPI0037E73A42